ncbi:MAG: FAD-dependent oxidoreductase, partial [Chitinophagales bacterium]|nr:FAD-dependent oxidoreductase [Chitinophagales bacterium]
LFRYDERNTFRNYDNMPLSEFIRLTRVPPKMQRVFASFARAFFAEPHQMSTAELIKSFHFYFLSNDQGLLYDVLNDDFQFSFIQPVMKFLREHHAEIYLNSEVENILYQDGKFNICNEWFDYCVLAADVKHVPIIISKSPSLHQFKDFYSKAMSLKTSARYALWRVWTDRFENGAYPYFVFTDRFRCLDSISFYHRFEQSSVEWSKKNGGGIFELHSYALPENLAREREIKNAFLDELFHYLPELKGFKIVHEYFQIKDDFTAYHTSLYGQRPETRTEIPGLFLAGDWVKTSHPFMLMEAAYTTGALAANYIMKNEGLCENQLFAVPERGLLA